LCVGQHARFVAVAIKRSPEKIHFDSIIAWRDRATKKPFLSVSAAKLKDGGIYLKSGRNNVHTTASNSRPAITAPATTGSGIQLPADKVIQ
jgi:hypothetical protein